MKRYWTAALISMFLAMMLLSGVSVVSANPATLSTGGDSKTMTGTYATMEDSIPTEVWLGAWLWILVSMIWFIIGIILCIWVYRDAKARGENAVLWLLIVLLTGIIGLIIWLVVRPKEKRR